MNNTSRPAERSRLWRCLHLHKPAAIAALSAACIILGGTAYAITDGFTRPPSWLNIQSAKLQILDSGDKIISVNTQDCHIQQWDATAQKLTADDRTYLYRIKAGSTLSSQQVLQMVQGNCEFAAQNASGVRESALQTYTAAHPEAADTLVGGFASEIITAIAADTLMTSGTVQDNGSLKTFHLTFHHIAKDVQVTQDGEQLSWADLHVGDSIAYVYRATGNALSQAATLSPWDLNTEETTIVYIEKNSANVQAYFDYTTHFGMDFEEVVPCEHGKDGYCAKYGPAAPPRTKLDNTPAAMSIQDAVIYHSNMSAATDQATVGDLHQKTLALMVPELAAKVAASQGDNYLLCGQAMTAFLTPQNTKMTNAGQVSRAVLFTAQDGSQFTVTYTADVLTHLITGIQCPQP